MSTLLIINVTCNQGSTGKISEQVGLLMKNSGWEVYYAHGARRVNSSQLRTISFSSVWGEYMHALKSLFLDADGLGSTHATQKLVEQIKEIKPDVIHIHNIHGYYLNYRVLFKYLNSTDIPIVLTLHDCWNFTGHCTHFVTVKCEKWKDVCFDCPLLNVSPRSFIDRSKRNHTLKKKMLANNKNLHIVTVSKWLKDMVLQSFFKNMAVRVIENGVDKNVFRSSIKEDDGIFKIVAVANVWTKDKGLYDFIKLSSLLQNDEKIYLVGYDKVKSKVKLPDKIIPVNRTANQEELAKIYQMSDVVVSMSYAETFGLTIAEGMACGTPGVVYDNTAQPTLITEDTGFIVKTGDVAAVYSAIQQIKKKGKGFYSKACRKHAEDCFDKDKCFEKYVELYEELLKK